MMSASEVMLPLAGKRTEGATSGNLVARARVAEIGCFLLRRGIESPKPVRQQVDLSEVWVHLVRTCKVRPAARLQRARVTETWLAPKSGY